MVVGMQMPAIVEATLDHGVESVVPRLQGRGSMVAYAIRRDGCSRCVECSCGSTFRLMGARIIMYRVLRR